MPPEYQPDPQQVHKDFVRRVNRFPQPAQEVIASLSSALLEPDVRQKIRNNPQEISGIVAQLTDTGLAQTDIRFVLGHFKLPTLPDVKEGK